MLVQVFQLGIYGGYFTKNSKYFQRSLSLLILNSLQSASIVYLIMLNLK